MKKIIKTIALVISTAVLISSCGTSEVESENNLQEIADVGEEVEVDSKENQNEDMQKNNVLVGEIDNSNGIFYLGMTTNEVLEVIGNEQLEITTDDIFYNFDERGVGTYSLGGDSEELQSSSTSYIIKVKGDISFVFDSNEILTNIVLSQPAEILSKSDMDNYISNGGDSILYNETYVTESGINLTSDVEDIISIYGEPVDGVYETDGTDYYVYKLQDNLYITIIVVGVPRNVIYNIEYSLSPPELIY